MILRRLLQLRCSENSFVKLTPHNFSNINRNKLKPDARLSEEQVNASIQQVQRDWKEEDRVRKRAEEVSDNYKLGAFMLLVTTILSIASY